MYGRTWMASPPRPSQSQTCTWAYTRTLEDLASSVFLKLDLHKVVVSGMHIATATSIKSGGMRARKRWMGFGGG